MKDQRWRESLTRRLPATAWRTRFAPAPTGFLHLGHLVNAMYVWGIARAHGGTVVLRIEDHDRTRCRFEYECALLDDLDWLGFVPDFANTDSFRAQQRSHTFRQSNNPQRYRDALEQLELRRAVYACNCTRRDIAGRAPHDAGEEPRYPGTCAHGLVDRASTSARRVRIVDEAEQFDDLRCGVIAQRPAQQCGDVLVRDRHDGFTYQFSVVVDDMAHDIDVIVRGEDLLASTGRQQAIARLLGRRTMPLVLHHPLLLRADGTKLSKANRDTSLRERRASGASADALRGEAALLCGLAETAAPLSVNDVVSLFR